MVQKLSSVIFHRSRDIQTVLCDVVVAVSFLKKDNLLPVYSKLEKKTKLLVTKRLVHGM